MRNWLINAYIGSMLILPNAGSDVYDGFPVQCFEGHTFYSSG